MGSPGEPLTRPSLADRFRAFWDAGGPAPDVFAYLASHPEATPQERLEVILIDQTYRARGDRRPSLQAYLAAAPELAGLPEFKTRLEQEPDEPLTDETLFLSSEAGTPPKSVAPPTPSPPQTLDELTAPNDLDCDPDTTTSGDTPPRALGGATPRTTADATQSFSTADASRILCDESGSFALREDIELGLPDASTDAPRFTIHGRLGQGGMGVVYRAFDRDRGETIALKTMRRVDPTALYRFKHEFRTLADLSHPNLVGLYELIALGDLWFFTMELIEGVDFIRFIRQDAPISNDPDATDPGRQEVLLSEAEVQSPLQEARPTRPVALPAAGLNRLRGAVRQLAEGLHALHEAGKLHRDVKPTNVLVTVSGRVVVLDFGLAADLESSGSLVGGEGLIVGTVSYMSPEQAAGRAVSPASDWYSVGVMLYQALTGRLPHEGFVHEILRKKITEDPPSPGSIVDGVPEDLGRLSMELLDRDPAHRPSGRDVLVRLLATPERSWATPSPATPTRMIGRVDQLAALESAFAAVREGESLAVLVSGRSGSGKSTLIQSFLARTAAAGEPVVLSGRCYERESVPYKALDSLLDALSRHLKELSEDEIEAILPDDVALLARLFPVLRRVEAVALAPRPAHETPDKFELRRRGSAALRELLTRIAKRRPLILAIDDLQWGDLDSAVLLLDLMRPPAPPPLLLLGTYRSEDGERSPFLRAIDSLGEAGQARSKRREIAVEPLSCRESRDLALELLGSQSPASRVAADLIAAEARGNPLFIDALVKHVQEGEGLVADKAMAGAIDLDTVLWALIERLPARARRLLETVSVSGCPISQLLAFRAADLGPEGGGAVLELRGSRFVRVSGPSQRDEMEVYHDQIRETVVRHLSQSELEARHRNLALVLQSAGKADLERLAVHFEGAGDRDRAGSYYAQAADQAADALAFVRAAKLYRRAIELHPEGDPAEVGRLRSRQGDALANAGRGPEAAEAYFAAAETAGVAARLELQRRATTQLLISGHVDEGLDALRDVLRQMGMNLPATPRRALASVLARRAFLRLRGLSFVTRDESQVSAEDLTRIDLCWTAVSGLSIIDPILGAEFQVRGLLLALKAGEPYRIVRAIAMEAAHVSTSGGPGRARFERLLRIAEPLAESVGHPHGRAMILLARGLSLLMLGEWRTACHWFDRAEELFRSQCTGIAWELDTVHNLCLWGRVHMGDLNTVRRRWPDLIKEARDRGDLYAETTLNTYYMTILRLADGDDATPGRELDTLMSLWTQRGFHIQHSTEFRARFHLLLYRGEVTAAWNLLQSVWPRYARSLLLRIQMIRIQMHELRARCALAVAATSRDPQPLLEQAGRDIAQLRREQRPWSLALARFLEAGIVHLRGDREMARKHLEDSAGQFEACDMHLNAAVARRCLGELISGMEGEALIAGADEWMRGQGIRDPERWAAMYAPGFVSRSQGL